MERTQYCNVGIQLTGHEHRNAILLAERYRHTLSQHVRWLLELEAIGVFEGALASWGRKAFAPFTPLPVATDRRYVIRRPKNAKRNQNESNDDTNKHALTPVAG